MCSGEGIVYVLLSFTKHGHYNIYANNLATLIHCAWP